jgi:hypothetical protein
MKRIPLLVVAVVVNLLLAGCAVHIPESSPYTGLALADTPLEEALLLDVGIGLFGFDPPVLDSGRPDLQLNDILTAEARYMPVMLRHTLAQMETWGEIYVMPALGSDHDVQVEARIVDANSHTLELVVTVRDATGAQWFERVYTEHVGDNVYSDQSIGVDDPFQGIYNRIANDMLAHVQTSFDERMLTTIRHTAELQFGNEFAPQLYGQYLQTGASIVQVLRMPPPNDPTVLHLRDIRQRDRAFQGLLQEHYVGFATRVADNYYEYRRQSFRELRDLQRKQRRARGDVIDGALWLGAAAAIGNIDGALSVATSAGAAVVGAVKVGRGILAYPDRSFFIDEIVESFATDVVTQTVELDEDVMILSGSAEEVYSEWKDILRARFDEERGLQP